MMAIAGIILESVTKWLAKIKQQSDVGCRLCKRAREHLGASTEILTEESYGHINSAFCNEMATTVTPPHGNGKRSVECDAQEVPEPAETSAADR